MALFELDDEFLADVGLADLPREFRKPFLQHVYDHLELRSGESLSEGMSNDQLAEFEAIIDRRTDVIDEWIAQHAPGYADDVIYQRLKEVIGADEPALRGEFAATKWLEVNRSDYRSVVESTLTEMREQIARHRDEILDATKETS